MRPESAPSASGKLHAKNPASEGAGSDSQGEQLALGGSMESAGAGSQFVQYIPFGENMIRYTKD